MNNPILIDPTNCETTLTDKAIVDCILNAHNFYAQSEGNKVVLYVWDGRKYVTNVDEFILKACLPIFENQRSRTRLQLERIKNEIKMKALHRTVIPKPPTMIAYKNGVLDINTMKFYQHDSSLFVINAHPFDYNSEAGCPEFIRWMESTVNLDDLSFLQEWMGYNLYTSTPEAAFTILLAQGSNGKTVFMKILEALIGKENVTNISLQSLADDPFATSDLYHKNANICADLESRIIREAGILKAVSAGDCISVQRKFGDRFNIEPYAKLTYACNKPPIIRDESNAIWNRMKAVVFPYIFSKTPDPTKGEKLAEDRNELLNRLTAELSGINNWSLLGLKRLIGNRFTFSYNLTTEQVRSFYQSQSDPVQAFFDKCITQTDDEDDIIPAAALAQQFQVWVAKQGHMKISTDMFWKRFNYMGMKLTQSQTTDERGKPIHRRCLVGYTMSI